MKPELLSFWVNTQGSCDESKEHSDEERTYEHSDEEHAALAACGSTRKSFGSRRDDCSDEGLLEEEEVVEVDVLIVGCGPVGLTLANALGAHGVRTLAIEQREREVFYSRPSASFLFEISNHVTKLGILYI